MPKRFDLDSFFYGSICTKLRYAKKIQGVSFSNLIYLQLKFYKNKTKKCRKLEK